MKVNTWDQDLMRYIESKLHEPFDWGKHDCLTFISGAIEVQTGENPLKKEILKYKDAKSGISAYNRYRKAGKSYKTTLDSVLSRFEGVIPPRGSIVAHGGIEGLGEVFGAALGVMISNRAAYVGESGLVFLPFEKTQKAWLV